MPVFITTNIPRIPTHSKKERWLCGFKKALKLYETIVIKNKTKIPVRKSFINLMIV